MSKTTIIGYISVNQLTDLIVNTQNDTCMVHMHSLSHQMWNEKMKNLVHFVRFSKADKLS